MEPASEPGAVHLHGTEPGTGIGTERVCDVYRISLCRGGRRSRYRSHRRHLGGKTDATEEDLTALVNAIKSYLENGITTVIVTGSQPAKLVKDGYLTPLTSLAFEQLTYAYWDENTDSYWGTVDLIYRDVTEIVEYEFYVCDVLKSITLPKVTTVGDRGFWACYYLETLTFGSVVTDINDNSGEVFYDLG